MRPLPAAPPQGRAIAPSGSTVYVGGYFTDFPTVYVERPFSKVMGGTLAGAAGRAERFTGLHVFNPVTKMDLVEPDQVMFDQVIVRSQL